jgi:hypothetical protein
MERNRFQRNEIPEPPSIAVASPLAWVAILPELAGRERNNHVNEEQLAAANHQSAPQPRLSMHSLFGPALTFLGGRRSATLPLNLRPQVK